MSRFLNPRLNGRLKLVNMHETQICMKTEFMVLLYSTREFSQLTTCFLHLRKGRKWRRTNCHQQLFRSLGTAVYSLSSNLLISIAFSVGASPYSSSPFLFTQLITNSSITMIKSDRLVWMSFGAFECRSYIPSLNLSLCFSSAAFTSSSSFALLSVCFFSS